MAWRDIMVFTDGSDDGLTRMRLACDIAETEQAHLEANVVVPLVRPIRGMNDDVFVRVYEEARRAARETGAAAVAKLRALAPSDPKRASVHTLETAFDDVRALAARSARASDLIIIAQPEALDGSELDTEIFVGAILGGGRPCLMLPRWIEPHTWGRRALIAWKATAQASRAVQGALPLLRRAQCVRICLANPRSEREGEDQRSLERLATYLLRHGVHVEDPVIGESWEGPEEMIASQLEGFNADLLVMGAYGRARLQEIVFGGMTVAMVRQARMPILFAH